MQFRQLFRVLIALTLCNVGIWLYNGQALAQGVFRFPLFYVPESLDPVVDNSIFTYHVVNQVYDGLTAFDSNLRVVPGLARSWTVSRDGLEYTFALRRNVEFHDGRSFTARDAVFSLTRVFHPDNKYIPEMLVDRIEGASDYRDGKADTISGITALSDYQLRVRLTEPYAPFLAALAMPIIRIVPAGAGPEMLSRAPVGTGPFSFTSWMDNAIVLKANARYYRGRPALDEVRFLLYPQAGRDRAFKDYLAGKLEGCELPGDADIKTLKSGEHQVLIRPRLALLFYGFNTRIKPLDERRVRMAIVLAHDQRRHVEEELGGNYIPAYQVVPPGMPGYTPENSLLKFDPERAIRLLEEAGYPGGQGLPEIEIASASASDFARKELSLFEKDMARIGIKVKTVFVDGWQTFTEGLSEGRYAIYRYALFADIPDPDDLLSTLFESDSSTNFTGWKDPGVDSLLRRAKGESDLVKRISYYREAERKILLQAPFSPVLYLTTQVVFQPYVKGIELPATGTTNLPLFRVSLDR